jgi:hypothetical protein
MVRKRDLIAEWKIVDAEWYEIFARAGLEKVFRIHLKFDAGAREVRASDHQYIRSWSAGVPHLEASMSRFSGQTQSVQFGTTYAFTEELRPGQVYNYRFSTRELKGRSRRPSPGAAGPTRALPSASSNPPGI